MPAQNQRIESSTKNKVTPNDIGIDPPTSTVLLLEKPTVTPLFSGNKSTLGTEGVAELESAKEIKKNQNTREYIDKLKKQDSICSEVVDTKSYDLSTVFEEVQYRNNIPTTISNTNLGTVYGKYDNKLGIVKYKDKKDSVHRKKKVTTTNDNLLVLATTNTKIACRGRKKTSIHQQKQDSTQINQLVEESTEKTAENHSTGKVDSSNSINIFHVEDTSSRKKLFQVDESNTKQDILQKNYSNK